MFITLEVPYAVASINFNYFELIFILMISHFEGIYFLAKFGVLTDPTIFFLLKNFFMMYEDIRRTLIFYFDYKEAKLEYKQDILNNVDQIKTSSF